MNHISEKGIEGITQFLAAQHRSGMRFRRVDIMAWVAGAELNLRNGNPPAINISPAFSLSGRGETHTVGAEGLEVYI